MMAFSSALLALCLALIFGCGDAFIADSSAAGNPKAILAEGAVIGTTTKLASVPTTVVNQFLGVPFAAPPCRFEPPEKPKPWTRPYTATAYKPSCIQQFTSSSSEQLFNIGSPQESEDCLYLNVFAPASKPKGSGRAVLFWIYGGNLQFGTARLPAYDGSSFAANQDVIVVTINYRTNVFGFATSPAIPVDKRNLGFLDQRLALSWVQKNIHAFGGDPSRVTIFGESAGGFSVKQLVALPPPGRPQFRAAIMQSQGQSNTGTGLESWEALVAALGCNSTTTTTESSSYSSPPSTSPASSPDDQKLACVRTANATLIRTTLSAAALPFPPTIDNVTATAHVELRLHARTAARVPLLIGNNADEGTLFAPTVGSATALLASIFGVVDDDVNTTTSSSSQLTPAALRARAAYPPDMPDLALRAHIITDANFDCFTRDFAREAGADGYAVWRYYYNASFPNTTPFLGAGAWHSSEVVEVFGTYPRGGGGGGGGTTATAAAATKHQVELSGYMQKAWADFAKGVEGAPGWVEVGGAEADLQMLGDVGGVKGFGGTSVVPAEVGVDERCAVYEEVRRVVGL